MSEPSTNPKARFSNRVEQYIRYRPGYPPGVLQTLQTIWGLRAESRIADVGSGTGLLAVQFLELGCSVVGVEPNREMREAGERLLAAYPNFFSSSGSAEETGLPGAMFDFVTAGQAFHWFDPPAARSEFQRILKPGGVVVLVWNGRQVDATPFLREYEALLQTYATDYNQINHRNTEEDPETIPALFGGPYRVDTFANEQLFDFDGVAGRMLSSSYVPAQGDPAAEAMLADLRRAFERHQQNGVIAFRYDTRMFSGNLA
jgi:SAM-dependent methyltransferase